MTTKTSGSHKLKEKQPSKFDHGIYSRISSRNLFIYSVHYLLEQKIEVGMEDIVFACFLLFPQKFALKKYPRWPDLATVSRRMNDSRSKGYIAVNTDFGFKLTAKGARLAERVAKALGVSTPKRAVKASSPQPKKHVATPTRKTKVVHKKKITSPVQMKEVSTISTSLNVVIARPVRKKKLAPPNVSPSTQAKKTQSPLKKEISRFKPVKKAQSAQPTKAHPEHRQRM